PGQLERRLLRELLHVIGPASAAEDEPAAVVVDPEVVDLAPRPLRDVPLDVLGTRRPVAGPRGEGLGRMCKHLGNLRRSDHFASNPFPRRQGTRAPGRVAFSRPAWRPGPTPARTRGRRPRG